MRRAIFVQNVPCISYSYEIESINTPNNNYRPYIYDYMLQYYCARRIAPGNTFLVGTLKDPHEQTYSTWNRKYAEGCFFMRAYYTLETML